ncbi:MAG: hypothetical protein ACR2QM_06400 [Longimicrobiales bacterium]
MTDDQAWAVVSTYPGLVEAELALGRLESAGIPARVDQGANVGLFGPGHATPLGGVSLLVEASELASARSALDLDYGA